MVSEDMRDLIDEIMNPKEEVSERKYESNKTVYKNLVLRDLKGKRFEFTGSLTLEIKDGTLFVSAIKD